MIFFSSIFYSYNNEEENSNACYSNKEEDSMLSWATRPFTLKFGLK